MVDPTAFLRVPDPGISQGMYQGLASAAMGTQQGRALRKDAQEQQAMALGKSAVESWKQKDLNGYQAKLRQLAALDPKAANDINKTFGTINWQNLVETGYRVYAAAASKDPEAQNKLLDQSIDTLSAGPGHWMTQALEQMRNMPTKTKDEKIERNAQLIGSVELLKNLGVYPKESFGGAAGQKPYQKTGAYYVRNTDTGEISRAVDVFDPNTGELKPQYTEMGKNLELVSGEGLTAKEKSELRIETKRGETRASTEEKRAQSVIDDGITAAESIAGLKRGIELLDSVKTGGFHAAALRAKQLFGIETAEEGELSNQLSKAVLSQLRTTFGAAFTENEGKRLERIEASFSKSPEANRQLLNQALRMAQRKADRALKKAEEMGDTGAVEDIQALLNFSYSEKPQTAPSPQTQSTPGNLPAINRQQAGQYRTFNSMQEGEQSGEKYFIFNGTLYEN